MDLSKSFCHCAVSENEQRTEPSQEVEKNSPDDAQTLTVSETRPTWRIFTYLCKPGGVGFSIT